MRSFLIILNFGKIKDRGNSGFLTKGSTGFDKLFTFNHLTTPPRLRNCLAIALNIVTLPHCLIVLQSPYLCANMALEEITDDLDIKKEIERGELKEYILHIAKLPTGSVVNLHIYIYRGKKNGPVLLVSGGLHGDEVNGIEIIRRMMKQDLLQPVAGIVIAIQIGRAHV